MAQKPTLVREVADQNADKGGSKIVKHLLDVIYGWPKDDDAYQETLHDDRNVFALPSLEPGKEYFWRVDAKRGGHVYKGDVWSFSTI